MSIVDESGTDKYTRKGGHIFKMNCGWGWPQFIPRDQLFGKENGFIRNNTLYLTGSFDFIDERIFELKQLESKAGEKMKDLFSRRSFTDLEIKVQKKLIPAHKVVLAANSHVLAETLLDLKNQNVLELKDLEFEVAEEMINFIYDGKVGDMEKYAKPLLDIADKFGIDRLKVYCQKYFYGMLSVENAIETLKFSAKCHAKKLKQETIEYIQK
jgi:speckle-type POZ protein